MAEVLALESLYTRVTSLLAADATPCVSTFGWRAPAQWALENRIAWTPGDATGSAGESAPARFPGGHPRTLGTFRELFTVLIFGADPTAPDDELAQYRVVRFLRDAFERAAYKIAYGAFRITRQEWRRPERKELRHGAALRLTCEIDASVPDMPYPEAGGTTLVYPPLHALIDVQDEELLLIGEDLTITYLASDTDPVTINGDFVFAVVPNAD